jgi:type VI protein secretion system component VasF
MLLAEAQPTVSLDRLSPKVTVREQTRAPRHCELALWLRLYLCVVYILYMYILFVWSEKAKSPSVGQEGEAPECRSRERSPRV